MYVNPITQEVKQAISQVLAADFGWTGQPESLIINETKPEFEGDLTLVLFGLAKAMGQSPDPLGQSLGQKLTDRFPTLFSGHQVVKGFLNLSLPDKKWLEDFQLQCTDPQTVPTTKRPERIMVEYSSPNTNKPLHLGHLRNIFLGWSIAAILKKTGNELVKSCVVNDRGIHICKSMIAWQRFGNGETPSSTGM